MAKASDNKWRRGPFADLKPPGKVVTPSPTVLPEPVKPKPSDDGEGFKRSDRRNVSKL